MKNVHFIYDMGEIRVVMVGKKRNAIINENMEEAMIIFVINGSGEIKERDRAICMEKGGMIVLPSPCKGCTAKSVSASFQLFVVPFTGAKAFRANQKWYIEEGENHFLRDKKIMGFPKLAGYHLNQMHQAWVRNNQEKKKRTIQHHFSRLMEVIFDNPMEFLADIEDRIAAVKDYINDHFQETIPINQLVTYSKMSTSMFYRRFKQDTGFTPRQYIINKKMAEAKKMLTDTSMSISDIAYEVGYEDSYYFSRLFKQSVGVSPQKFQNQSALLHTGLEK